MERKKDYKQMDFFYNEDDLMLFDNLPELIGLGQLSRFLGVSKKTFYDWNYRGEMRKNNIPQSLFVKIGGKLYARKDILKKWIYDRKSPLN